MQIREVGGVGRGSVVRGRAASLHRHRANSGSTYVASSVTRNKAKVKQNTPMQPFANKADFSVRPICSFVMKRPIRELLGDIKRPK